MPTLPIERVRNIGIVAHIDAGKTTTTERFIFYTGRSHRMGEVHDGQAVMDFRPDERDRGITISAAATTLYWKDHEIQLIDTPGHVDFTAEVERALRVLDGAVVIFDGVEGVEPQSETVWHQADRYHVPRIAFVNKMDRVGADFDAAVLSMRERLRARAVPLQFPDGAAETLRGIVDVVGMRYLTFDAATLGRDVVAGPVPDRLLDEARRRRQEAIESLAEVHDPLAELFLAEAEVSADALTAAARAATIARTAVPVYCGASLRNLGVQPLLDAVCALLPSPVDVPPLTGHDPRTGAPLDRPCSPKAPFSALVFKVVATPSADLFYLRVYSGRLPAGERAFNPRTGERERLRRVLRMHADRGEPVEVLEAGDIVAVAALHRSQTGDTLCDEAAPVLLEPIQFPSTVVSVAVEPRSSADRDRLSEILARVQREDPTLRSSVDPETGQLLLSGMGELHLDVTLGRLARDFGLSLASGKPRVSFRETVRAGSRGEAEYRRQVGGENLFARVAIEVEPLPEPGASVVAESALAHGAVPAAMVAGLVDSLRNAADGGGVFGYPVTGVRLRLVEAVFDDVGQPEIALNSATSLAFRDVLRRVGGVVLEPYGRLEVRVPEDFLGAVVKTLNQRRAVVEDTGFSRSAVVVRGVVPIGEMFGYLTLLRSSTQGRGSFSLEPLDYRPVPDQLAASQHQRLYD
ncbi:MAG TPA: elongation factor G [Candidatus Polarisedimenticolaceae bacterium]